MIWICKITRDRRGGHISTSAVDPETLQPWEELHTVDDVADNSSTFKGIDQPLIKAALPKAYMVENKRTSFPDMWWGENGLLIISDAFRQIIEDHDPYLHHIWPLALLTKKGAAYPNKAHAFVPGVHAAAISEKQSDIFIKEERLFPPIGKFPASLSPRRTWLKPGYDAVIDRTGLPGNHLWWDHGLTRPYLLFSDTLHAAMKAAGLKTMPIKKLRDLKD